ncbi:unnamed protein product [Cladocopium goreaui]|uniref:BTB domain-containing protein n=1 Tax=Cladocopium goreaui TaxID=2562237 RepID=A0A9P1DMY1_9DINO|nr:unnamed protein product [Cladocopium goreaui]
MVSHQWLWEALRNGKDDVVISRLVPPDWDWNQVHPSLGTPLMAIVPDGLRLSSNTSRTAPIWKLIRFCMAQGADPRKVAHHLENSRSTWGSEGTAYPKLDAVDRSGHSALSLVFSFRRACCKFEKEYAAQIANADQMLSVFAEFVPEEDPVVLVPEGTVEMWEQLLADESCADVELEVSGVCADSTSGTSGTSGTLRAHGAVLRSASPVLNALLSAPMKEGRSGHIRVEGVTLEAARLFLRLMYTGNSPDTPSMVVLLGALDLAHRWQVPHIVAMAENELVAMVSPETLGELCEAALLKALPKLRSACRCFALTTPDVESAISREDFPTRAQRELRHLLHPATSKRRRSTSDGQ